MMTRVSITILFLKNNGNDLMRASEKICEYNFLFFTG
jgi:hypothetical protein